MQQPDPKNTEKLLKLLEKFLDDLETNLLVGVDAEGDPTSGAVMFEHTTYKLDTMRFLAIVCATELKDYLENPEGLEGDTENYN